MVLPGGDFSLDGEIEVIDEVELPTLTYKIDLKRGRFTGMVDGLQAMEQAIFKILNTNRFEHMIYSDDYGFENIIGSDRIFINAELPRRIEESLLQDERITSVDIISIDFADDIANVKILCNTIYGDVNVLKEVGINV